MIKTKKIMTAALLGLGIFSVFGYSSLTVQAIYDPNAPGSSENKIETKMINAEVKENDGIMTITNTGDDDVMTITSTGDEKNDDVISTTEKNESSEAITTSTPNVDKEDTTHEKEFDTLILLGVGVFLLLALALLWKKKK